MKPILRYSSTFENMVFLSGIVIGILLSWFVIYIWPVSYEPISRAKELSIVSLTILNNYPKHMEVKYYLIFLFTTTLTVLTLWFCYIYLSTGSLKTIDRETVVSKDITFPKWGYCVTALVAVYLTYYSSYFSSMWINNWYLLGEQGQNLSWARGILNGKVLYKDSFVLFGPLMEYPLALMMKIFGETVFIARVYSYLTYVITAVIIGTIPFAIFRKKWEASIT